MPGRQDTGSPAFPKQPLGQASLGGEGTGLFLSGPFNHRGVCEPVGASVFPPGTLVMTPASRGMGRALQAVGELFG